MRLVPFAPYNAARQSACRVLILGREMRCRRPLPPSGESQLCPIFSCW